VLPVAGVCVDVVDGAGPFGGVGSGVGGRGTVGERLLHRGRPERAGPMLTSATLPPCTATPTIAQSMARLVNFWANATPGARAIVLRHSTRGPVERAC